MARAARLAPLAATALFLSLVVTPAALATCSGTSCAYEVVALGEQVVGAAAGIVAHPTEGWQECPGVAFCSDSDPIFYAASCPLNDFPLACPYAHYRDFAGDGFDWGNGHAGGFAPKEGAAITAFGQGQAWNFNGNSLAPCAGPSLAYLEASKKAFGLEPSITFGFGAASAGFSGSGFIACEDGDRVQPQQSDLLPGSQFPDGAWSARKVALHWSWEMSVGAPEGALRTVDYSYSDDEGVKTTFHGRLVEYR